MTRKSDTRRKGAGKDKKGLRFALSQRLMRISIVRRWYVRRTLKYIDKWRAKGRTLPENMQDVARFLDRVPKYKRAETFEEAMKASQETPDMGRQMRRATSRQRRSGKGGGGYRPGMAPGTIKQGRRPPR